MASKWNHGSRLVSDWLMNSATPLLLKSLESMVNLRRR